MIIVRDVFQAKYGKGGDLVALFVEHTPAVSWAGFGNNLLWVTLRNIIGGGLFVGGLYWFASRKEEESQ